RRGRDREPVGTPARARSPGVRAADAAHASGRPGRAARPWNVQRHRAGALRRLLVDLVPGAGDRPEVDRRPGGCAAPWLARPPGALPLLFGPAEGARGGAARAGPRRRGALLPTPLPRRRDRGSADGADAAPAARSRRRSAP